MFLPCRCFSDLSQCAEGYTLAVWLRLGPMLTSQEKYILSSGGQTRGITTGGIAVVMKNRKLSVEVRIKSNLRKWIKNNISVEVDTWFHLAVTWEKNGNLTVFVDGTPLSPVTSSPYTVGASPSTANMHVGKPNNALNYYGELTIDEWNYWNSSLRSNHIKSLYGSYS